MKAARGFTLIEILVALTMFAVAGGMLLQLFEGGLRAARTAADYTHAVVLAQSKLTEMQAFSDLRPGSEEGEFDERYRWRVVLSEYLDEESENRDPIIPLDLTITVAWGDPGDEQTFVLRSLCLTSETPE